MDPYKINYGLYILSQNVNIEGNYDDCVDVILIHGINGSPLKTWRILCDKKTSSNYTLWPKQWLANDIPNIRIISIGFDSKFLRWHLDCPSSSFRVPEASRYLIKSLVEAGVGQRPIIWIGHSIGGILIKDIITKCNRKAARDVKYCDRLSKMTKGTIFYSVPHHGTPIAFKLDYLVPAFDTKYVKNDCGFTSKLNTNFINYLKEHHISCLNFAESLPTALNLGISMVIVPPDCSDINYGDFIVLDRNHSQTCKPEDSGDISYTATKQFIDNIVNHINKT